jgi:uncharacterized protein involved in outer membrane biogenesis
MSAPWYRSKLFLIAAGVVVLLLVTLLIAPYLLDLNRYRPLIVSQLEQATGRRVEIESLRLHFLPSVRVVVSNLRVKNPSGFPEGDTVGINRVDIGVAVGALLRREVEVTSVSVSGVELNLLTNEAGQNNYESLLEPRRAAGGKKPAAAPVSLARIGSVSVSDVRINSGTFWRRDRRVHPSWSLTGANLEASGFDLSDPGWMSKAEASVDLSSIEVASPALKQPLRFASGTVRARNNVAEGDYALALGPLRGGGGVKIANLARFSAAEFTMNVKEVDLAELGALSSGKSSAGPRPPAGSAALLARGTVRVEKVVAAPLAANNLDAKVRLYANRLEVDPFTLDLYGGRARGTMGVDLASEAMGTRLATQLSGVNVGQLVAAAAPKSKTKVTGTLEADARLGTSLAAGDPLGALGGDGTFAVRNGTVPGLNLGGALVEMAKLMQISVPAGDTKFSYFGGDFRLANRRVHSQELKLEADALDATLRGSLGFDETLSYTGTGMLKGQGTAQPQQSESSPLGGLRRVFGRVAQTAMQITGMRVPFAVSGTVQDPKFVLTGPPAPIR